MPYRYTIEELEKFSDYEMLYAVCREREETLTNVYSPFSKRLTQLMQKLGYLDELTKPKNGFLFPGMLAQERQMKKLR